MKKHKKNIVLSLLFFIFCTHSSWANATEKVEKSNKLIISTIEDTKVLAGEEIEEKIAEQIILVDFKDKAHINFFSKKLNGDKNTLALIGSSSDTLFAACVKGKISSSKISANNGKLLLWIPAKKKPKRFAFDASKLLKSTNFNKAKNVKSLLEKLSKKQKTLLYFGLLRHTGINASASSIKSIENARRAYLQNPSIIKLRFSSTDDKTLAQNVVKEFINSLQNGDKETVSWLLNPALFEVQEEGISNNTLNHRNLFVKQLISQRDWSILKDSKIKNTKDITKWLVETKNKTYAVSLFSGDGLYYVDSFIEKQKI